MPEPICTTLNQAESCAARMAAGDDADGRVIGFAIQVAIRAIQTNHGCAFVEHLTLLSDHYGLCTGHATQNENREGH